VLKINVVAQPGGFAGKTRKGYLRAPSYLKGSAAMCLAIPGRIIEVVDSENRLAQVDVAGVKRTINIGLLDDDGTGVDTGDWVLIHVGFAMSRVDEEEAIATRTQLERMGQDYEAELEELKASVIE
jgi:hydrogenase expression/formation protein HypC